MKSLLRQLENESLLLLYIADELPAEDRRELEILLARDGGLRAQLAALRAAGEASFGALAELDAAGTLPAIEPAMRIVSRSMRQWQVDRLTRNAIAPVAKSRMSYLAWTGGSAVAALIAFCIWWGFRSDPVTPEISSTQHMEQVSPSRASPGQASPGQASPGPITIAQGPSVELPEAAPTGQVPQGPVQIVTVDAASQKLGDLETLVNDDLQ